MVKTTNLSGRSAIITGASQGLGQGIAEMFVRAGASVFLVARDGERLQDVRQSLIPLAITPDQRVHAMRGDVSEPDICIEIVRAAQEALPNVMILVNNAGIYGPMGKIEDVDWAEWVEAIRINVFGTAVMCRAIIPALRTRAYGKIINLSGGGATAPLPYLSAYATSKAAVVRLTETLAEELRDAHIDVNAIAPGALNTRLLDQVLAAGAENVGNDFYQRALAQRDQGGVPLDVGAGLALFLASAASDGITGRLLSAVWDDWETLPQQREELRDSDIFTLRRIVPRDRDKDWGSR